VARLDGVVIAARVDARLSRPPADVYDLLADVRNELRWNPSIRSAEKETEGPIGAGTVFRTRYRGFGAMRVDLVEAERPSALTFRAEAKAIAMRIRLTFADDDGGTRLHCAAESSLRGVWRPLEPLLAPLLRAEVRKRPGQFERALALGDGGQTPTAQPV
jgi:uncharacterized protein YndB with AHSA1/START domain